MAYLKWSRAISSFTLVVAALLLIGRACSRRQQVDTQPVLREGEHEKFIFNSKDKTVTRVSTIPLLGSVRVWPHLGRRQSTETFDGVRTASVTIPEGDGVVVLKAQTKGWVFEPGIGFAFADEPRADIDVQIFYWRRFGINAGITASRRWQVRSLITGSYNFYSNTSLVVGVDSSKEFNVGVRVAL